jgi:DNA-binding cell septation regulator SpoVG
MGKFDLAKSVMSVKAPPLDRKETRLLTEEIENRPWNNQVAQPLSKEVAQGVQQKVAQVVPQEVAQALWVAQEVAQSVPKKVAQNKPQRVAQDRPQMVAQSKSNLDKQLVRNKVKVLKGQIDLIPDVEGKKRFVRDIGWGISTEKRGKKYYLFGIKKLCGDKYKLYIGNATN